MRSPLYTYFKNLVFEIKYTLLTTVVTENYTHNNQLLHNIRRRIRVGPNRFDKKFCQKDVEYISRRGFVFFFKSHIRSNKDIESLFFSNHI